VREGRGSPSFASHQMQISAHGEMDGRLFCTQGGGNIFSQISNTPLSTARKGGKNIRFGKMEIFFCGRVVVPKDDFEGRHRRPVVRPDDDPSARVCLRPRGSRGRGGLLIERRSGERSPGPRSLPFEHCYRLHIVMVTRRRITSDTKQWT